MNLFRFISMLPLLMVIPLIAGKVGAVRTAGGAGPSGDEQVDAPIRKEVAEGKMKKGHCPNCDKATSKNDQLKCTSKKGDSRHWICKNCVDKAVASYALSGVKDSKFSCPVCRVEEPIYWDSAGRMYGDAGPYYAAPF